MLQVFVETNWVVGLLAPVHHRDEAAERLLARARAGELSVHLPAPCLNEARKVLRQRFQPRNEARAIREFARRLAHEGGLTESEQSTIVRVCQSFEGRFTHDLTRLDERVAALRALPGVVVFPLTEGMLTRSTELAVEPDMDLGPYDNAVLGAVLVGASTARSAGATVCFAEKDSDLQPWDRSWRRREPLASLYDAAGLWVYGDFDLATPERPENWPENR